MFSVLHLPVSLRAAPALHELRAPANSAAHAGLAAGLLGCCAAPVLWVTASLDWYPPGLSWAGISPAHCLFAKARDDAEILASAEAALRGGLAVVAECGAFSRLAAKRLALAAKQGGKLGLVLRHAPAVTAQDSTAVTARWFVTSAPGGALRAELLYAKSVMPGIYYLDDRDAAPFSLPGLRRAG